MILVPEKKPIASLVLLCASVCVFGCVCLKSTGLSPSPSQSQIALLIKALKVQTYAVNTFISTGTLEIRYCTQRIPTTFLCIGSRNPFRLKLEITHSWGKPLMHILLLGQKVTIRDLYHHRTYQGQLNSHAPFFRMMPFLDKTILWSIMRAYPELMASGKISWQGKDRAFIIKKDRAITQEIKFDRNLRSPSLVRYRRLHVSIRYSQFAAKDHIIYAKVVEATDSKGKTSVRLNIKSIVFNPTLAPNLFNL